MPSYLAKHRHAPISARKARLIADMIRYKQVSEALTILKFSPQLGAKLYYKVVLSAQANAQGSGVQDVENLRIKRVWADDGLVMKRITPKARGSAGAILRRHAHLCVELSSE